MIEYRGKVELKDGERIDDLERNGYGIIQKPDGFCFGMDAVLLSGFAAVKPKGTAVDLGTGTGIIPILLEAKTNGAQFYGLEIQSEMADMARRSVMLNGLDSKVHIIEGDIRSIAYGSKNMMQPENEDVSAVAHREQLDEYAVGAMGQLKDLISRVDTVTSNPPYMKVSRGLRNPADIKAIARHELCCDLHDVCRAAAVLLKTGGHFYMVHRPLRLPEIITELKSLKLEPKRIKPVYPFIDKEANMVLIDAVKGGGAECRFEKPVIVYKSEGVYSDEIYDIYGY